MEDKREVKSEIPSPVDEENAAPETGAGASGSDGKLL